MPEQKIKPCPWCRIEYPDDPESETMCRVVLGGVHEVVCTQCHYRSPHGDTADEAIAAHNDLCQRLASAPALKEQNKKLLYAISHTVAQAALADHLGDIDWSDLLKAAGIKNDPFEDTDGSEEACPVDFYGTHNYLMLKELTPAVIDACKEDD